jgi:hypothetical protein
MGNVKLGHKRCSNVASRAMQVTLQTNRYTQSPHSRVCKLPSCNGYLRTLAGDAIVGYVRPHGDSVSSRLPIQSSRNVIGRDAQRRVRIDDAVGEVASEADIQCAFLVGGMHRT